MTSKTTRSRWFFIALFLFLLVALGASFFALRPPRGEGLVASPRLYACSGARGLEWDEGEGRLWMLETEVVKGKSWSHRSLAGKTENDVVILETPFSIESKMKDDFLEAFSSCRNSEGKTAADRWRVQQLPGTLAEIAEREQSKAPVPRGLLIPDEKSLPGFRSSEKDFSSSDEGYTMSYYDGANAKLEVSGQVLYENSSCAYYLSHPDKLMKAVKFKFSGNDGITFETKFKDDAGKDNQTTDLLYSDGGHHCLALSGTGSRFSAQDLIDLLKTFKRAP